MGQVKYKLSKFIKYTPGQLFFPGALVIDESSGVDRYYRMIGGGGWAEVKADEIEDDTDPALAALNRVKASGPYEIFVSKPPSRECPCGIVRADCEYHK